MAVDQQKPKAATPIERAALGHTAGEVVHRQRPRRRGRNAAIRTAPTSSWIDAIKGGAPFPPRAERTPMICCHGDGRCGKHYPFYYVIECGRLLVDGEVIVFYVCQDCRNHELLADENRRREEGLLADDEITGNRLVPVDGQLMPEVQAEEKRRRQESFVAAISELLGEADALGLLPPLRPSAHANTAF